MANYLADADLSRKILDVMSGSNAVAAVAFIQPSIAKRIVRSNERFRLLCDISYGATNPEALQILKDAENVSVNILDRFHGKVYRSDVGLVVGSANMSKAALGAVPGSIECGVSLKPQGQAASDFDVWFNDAWGRAEPLADELIDACSHKYLRNISPDVERPALLGWLSACARDDGLAVVLTNTETRDEELKQAVESVQDPKEKTALQQRLEEHDVDHHLWNVTKFPKRFISIHRYRNQISAAYHTELLYAGELKVTQMVAGNICGRMARGAEGIFLDPEEKKTLLATIPPCSRAGDIGQIFGSADDFIAKYLP